MTLSAVVIARDEERNIADCLEGLAFCDEIVVIDSGSRDKTASIARALGAKVYENTFVDFASQKNFGISKATGDWVLSIDADERVSSALSAEIRESLISPAVDGYTIPRENNIFGRLMRYGGNAGDRPLRLARKDKAVFEGRVHERIVLEGKVGRFRNPLKHLSTTSIADYMRKLNAYTSLEAQTLAERGVRADVKQMKRRPLAVFAMRHFVQKGFLDGIEGFMFSVLSAYYEFVRYAKHGEKIKREGIIP